MNSIIRTILFITLAALFVTCKCEQTTVNIIGSQSLKAYLYPKDEISMISVDTSGFFNSVHYKIQYVEKTELKEIKSIQNSSSHVALIVDLLIEDEDSDCAILEENNFKHSSVFLRCNKDFEFNGEIINSGTNLTTFGNNWDFLPPIIDGFVYGNDEFRVYLSTSFFEYGNFEQGENIFTIEFNTEDGVLIKEEIALLIE